VQEVSFISGAPPTCRLQKQIHICRCWLLRSVQVHDLIGEQPQRCGVTLKRSAKSRQKGNKSITSPIERFSIAFKERSDLDIQKLRQETESDHRTVEGAVALMHQGLSVAQYVQSLQQIYGIVAAWEERAAELAPPWLQPTLTARQRRSLLERDLAWFGVTERDDRRPKLPKMNDLPSLFGTMYVMEGSKLGGRFIARHVETALHLSDGQGNAYFYGDGNRTGPMWKEFCEILKVRIPEDQTEAVVFSAKAMFATFGAWMRGNLVMDGI
jgi:heme oxygenase (biliverdin-IX-beta and delta-forming)